MLLMQPLVALRPVFRWRYVDAQREEFEWHRASGVTFGHLQKHLCHHWHDCPDCWYTVTEKGWTFRGADWIEQVREEVTGWQMWQILHESRGVTEEGVCRLGYSCLTSCSVISRRIHPDSGAEREHNDRDDANLLGKRRMGRVVEAHLEDVTYSADKQRTVPIGHSEAGIESGAHARRAQWHGWL